MFCVNVPLRYNRNVSKYRNDLSRYRYIIPISPISSSGLIQVPLRHHHLHVSSHHTSCLLLLHRNKRSAFTFRPALKPGNKFLYNIKVCLSFMFCSGAGYFIRRCPDRDSGLRDLFLFTCLSSCRHFYLLVFFFLLRSLVFLKERCFNEQKAAIVQNKTSPHVTTVKKNNNNSPPCKLLLLIWNCIQASAYTARYLIDLQSYFHLYILIKAENLHESIPIPKQNLKVWKTSFHFDMYNNSIK